MNKIYIYIVGVLLFAACAETKPLYRPREIKQIEAASLYDSILQYYGNYSSFSTKFTAQVINPKPVQVKGTIRIKKDSIIWLSITPALNIEAFRCIFTKDSVQFVNRIDKVYYQGGYEIITSLTGVPLNYNTVQAILLNELVFYPFENIIDTLQTIKKYDISKRKNDLVMQNYSDKNRRALTGRKVDSLIDLQTLSIFIDNFRVSNIEIQDESKNLKIQTKYSFFAMEDSISFPQFINFEVKSKKDKMQMIINYDKTEFNPDQSYPFTINSKFKPFERK